MRINAFTTKSADSVQLGKFTVLVGPNNVGKSQTLRDIYRRFAEGAAARTVILERLQLEKPASFEELLDGLRVVPDRQHIDTHLVRGLGPGLADGESLRCNLQGLENQFNASGDLDFTFGNIAKLRVAYLDASQRLNVARQGPAFDPETQPPQTLLQALYVAGAGEDAELCKAFHDTFGLEIRLDYSGLTQMRLRVSPDFGPIPEDPRKANPILARFQTLDDQGDGFRSFVGVVLSVLLSRGRIILLDEPEAFLHPAQARQLGRWLGAHSKTSAGQILVATHNGDFLAGILASGEEVEVFRLNRVDSRTTYNKIPSEATSRLARNPVLSSQRVLSAVFYRGVVVCEADADRAVYQAVSTHEYGSDEIMFVHAHNKQTVPQVVYLLREAGIPVAAVLDVDVLNLSTDLQNAVTALSPTADVAPLEVLRKTVHQSVEAQSEDEALKSAAGAIQELTEQLSQRKHTLAGLRGALDRIRGGASKWAKIKRVGGAALDDATRGHFETLLSQLRTVGLFVVPVGELESWLDLGTRQKKRWIVLALEALAARKCSPELRAFVGDLLTYLGARATPAAAPTAHETAPDKQADRS